MATDFHRTIRASREDSRATAVVSVGASGILVAALAFWGARSSIDVWQTSPKARLQAIAAPHPIESPVLGRVTSTACALGKDVRAGDIVLELDAESFRAARSVTSSKLASIVMQLPLVETELLAWGRAASAGARVVASGDDLTALRGDIARVMSSYSAEELARSERLRESGLLGGLDMLKVVADTEHKRAELEALKMNALRDAWSLHREEERDRAAIERLRREAASLRGDKIATEEELARLDLEIDLRTIRAPVAGRIAKLTALQKGSVVAQGSQIAIVVPEGPLQIVAELPAGAVGRVAHGQLAEMRLESFPWTEFGTVEGRVDRVASEGGTDGVRVELTILPDQRHRIPLQHGLVGALSIRVDEVSPFHFFVRTLTGSPTVPASPAMAL